MADVTRRAGHAAWFAAGLLAATACGGDSDPATTEPDGAAASAATEPADPATTSPDAGEEDDCGGAAAAAQICKQAGAAAYPRVWGLSASTRWTARSCPSASRARAAS